ncbi:MAG: hypothetical protein BJ554DRAFT_7213 [Olpidium bornovanus]|uniref:Uncharacterized protein n=1 Tax=Olpidium bornovanus TaxID=278681 RepID=A0A8H8DJL0_9FUNG|nr:MAG: hypothetical protein BJ554DRAFT_7213 [Olpidium bornovanus]
MNCDDDPLVKAARGLAAPVSRATAGAVNRGGLDPVLRRFVGIFISLGASLFYALGLNIIQRDALRNEARPEHLQRKDYQRLCWYLGMAMFISSQVGGQAFVISDKVWRSLSRINLEKWMGMAFAGVGGLTSLLEKAFAGDNPFNQGTTLPAFIVAGLVVTAVLQIVCLNNALAVVESVVVVPIFYAFYTAVGLVNNLVYLDEFRYYSWYSLLCITLGIAVLVYGVHLLSVQKTPLAEEFCCSIVDVDGCPPPGEEDEEEANASTTVAAAETDGGAEGAKNEKNAGRGAEGPLAKDGENGVAAFAAARGEAGADDRSLDERSLSSTPVTRSSDVKVVVVERRSRSPPS